MRSQAVNDTRKTADIELLRILSEVTEPVTAAKIAEITGIKLKALRPSLKSASQIGFNKEDRTQRRESTALVGNHKVTLKTKRKPRLTPAEREQIREFVKAGMKPKDIADFLTNVTLATIYNVIRDKQEKATATVAVPAQTYTSGGLTFKFPAKPNPAYDFVISPQKGRMTDGFRLASQV